jgi:3-hydroxyisobutyrate dehydrogenase
MASHNYAVNFLLRLMTKDLAYAESEASGCGVHLKTSEAARSLFESAIAKGFGDEDMASVIEPLRDR